VVWEMGLVFFLFSSKASLIMGRYQVPRGGVFRYLEVLVGTSRCIVQDLEMAGSGSSKLMASNFCL
jgi:hypothetical protein